MLGTLAPFQIYLEFLLQSLGRCRTQAMAYELTFNSSVFA